MGAMKVAAFHKILLLGRYAHIHQMSAELHMHMTLESAWMNQESIACLKRALT